MFSFEVIFNFETDDIEANLGSDSQSTFCQSKIRQNFFKAHCHATFQAVAADGVIITRFLFTVFYCCSYLYYNEKIFFEEFVCFSRKKTTEFKVILSLLRLKSLFSEESKLEEFFKIFSYYCHKITYRQEFKRPQLYSNCVFYEHHLVAFKDCHGIHLAIFRQLSVVRRSLED